MPMLINAMEIIYKNEFTYMFSSNLVNLHTCHIIKYVKTYIYVLIQPGGLTYMSHISTYT